jgi:hypothetical protein
MPDDIVAGYIQDIGLYPFHGSFFTRRVIEAFIQETKNSNDVILHFDSTGGSVAPIPGAIDRKTVYLYSLVMSNGSLPVFEFLTTWHRAFAVQNQLNVFLRSIRLLNNGQNATANYVVIDYSMALIHACVMAFNKCSLKSYLHRCWRILPMG